MREANQAFCSNEKEVCTQANFLFTLEPFPVFNWLEVTSGVAIPNESAVSPASRGPALLPTLHSEAYQGT